MPKRVLDVGQCDLDHGTLRAWLEREFGAEVLRAHQLSDALDALRAGGIDLVLVNRKLDIDYSDGLAVIVALREAPSGAEVPVMLVSNYPEYQAHAVASGAALGFGKAELNRPEARARVAAILETAES